MFLQSFYNKLTPERFHVGRVRSENARIDRGNEAGKFINFRDRPATGYVCAMKRPGLPVNKLDTARVKWFSSNIENR
jgi:hypothetical protein